MALTTQQWLQLGALTASIAGQTLSSIGQNKNASKYYDNYAFNANNSRYGQYNWNSKELTQEDRNMLLAAWNSPQYGPTLKAQYGSFENYVQNGGFKHSATSNTSQYPYVNPYNATQNQNGLSATGSFLNQLSSAATSKGGGLSSLLSSFSGTSGLSEGATSAINDMQNAKTFNDLEKAISAAEATSSARGAKASEKNQNAAQIKGQENKISELNNTLQRLNNSIATRNKTIDDLDKQINALKPEDSNYANMKNQLETQKKAEIKARDQEIKRRDKINNEELPKEKETLNKLNETKKEIEQAEKDVKKLDKEIQQQEKRLDKLHKKENKKTNNQAQT